MLPAVTQNNTQQNKKSKYNLYSSAVIQFVIIFFLRTLESTRYHLTQTLYHIKRNSIKIHR